MYFGYNLIPTIENTDIQKACIHNWMSAKGTFYHQKSKFWECTRCGANIIMERWEYFIIKGIVIPDLIWALPNKQQRKEAEQKIKELTNHAA